MGYNDDLKINRTLQKIMIDKKIKNNQIADKLGKSKQVISNQLNTQVNLTIETITEIAEAMGLETQIIFVEKETGKQIAVE